jgi:hypothetical protein
MPSGRRNTRRTRGGDASPDKTNDITTDTDAPTTLIAMETPGAPKAKRVQSRPETPNEEEELLDVQGTLRSLCDEANQQRNLQQKFIREIFSQYNDLREENKQLREANKSLSEANEQLWEELQEVRVGLAEVAAKAAFLTPERVLPAQPAIMQPKPTIVPTQGLTTVLTQGPTTVPTQGPTTVPTQGPTTVPTQGPTTVPTQGPTTVPTQGPTTVHTQGPVGRERVVVVSLGEAAGKLREKPLSAIKELAQKELSNKAETKGVKVVGISAIVGERLEIQTESKEQAENARHNQGWTVVLGKDARVKQPAWHPIKVDGVARANICKKTGNGWQFKQGLESLINKSNTRPDLPVKVMKAYWLSRPSEKAAGSMAIYLDSREVAQQVIREGIFLIGANATYPAPFLSQERPIRCYRCNQYGHKQSKCSAENPGCGKCAGVHETMNCPGTAPDKCITCQGAHKVVDLSCEAWQKEKKKVERRSKTRA